MLGQMPKQRHVTLCVQGHTAIKDMPGIQTPLSSIVCALGHSSVNQEYLTMWEIFLVVLLSEIPERLILIEHLV